MRLTLRLRKSRQVAFKTPPREPLQATKVTRPSASERSSFVCGLSVLLLTFGAVVAHAQDYTSIVVFGDSLSDTGNVAHLTQDKYGVRIPGPLADYTDGRFTDGDDTLPVAQKYFGLWIEQLAATLPAKPIITNSLD